MNSLIIYLTLLLCTLNIQVHCSYPLTVEGDNLPLPPHLFSTSTVVYNDTIYSYGGNIPFKLWGSDKLFTYTLDPSTGKMVVRLENEDNGPICAFCNAVLFPDSNEILVFSGQNYNETSIFYNNQTIWQPNQTVLPHFYDLKEKTWKVTPPTQRTGNDDIFYLRHSSTTVMNGNDGVYILGGYISYYGYRRDGWYYNRHDNSYTPISLPNNNTYIDAIGYIDLDGNLALLGGCNQTRGTLYEGCYDLSRINIYNNVTKTWSYKQATRQTSPSLSVLAGAATQVDYDRKLLYVSGGHYLSHNIQYSYKGFSMLDLEKNIWIYGLPEENSENQMPLFEASGALIMNNSYFVRLFGVSITDYQVIDVNTVDILDLKFSTSFTNETYKNQTQPIKWIASAVQDNTNSPKRRVLQYIGLICILVVVTVTVALFAYFRRKSLPKYWQGFKKAVLWNPRKGEPISTEISRLLVKIISLAILISFLAYNINDVATSTISNSSSSKDIGLITVPDFRICYTGWDFNLKDNNFRPQCIYIGDRQTSVCPLSELESFYYTPHYPSQSDNRMRCFMFAPEEPIKVGSKNASVVVRTSGTTNTGKEVIYVQFYRREENINRIIFNNESLPGITKSDVLNWSLNETQSDLQVNAFPDSFTTIKYQETDYEKIQNDSKWNYFGAYPNFIKYTELSIDYSQPVIYDKVGLNSTKQRFFNSFTVIPKEFKRTTITEKRDSTILHVFGSIGGAISLLLALQVILFGTRPSSPWGIFHYWTWNKKRTPPDLEEQFHIDEAQVPFINPVDQRFNDVFNKNSDQEDVKDTSSSSSTPLVNKNSVEDRVSRLEARNQLLELVMKNYYLDDQVFLAIGHTRKAPEKDTQPEKTETNNLDSDQEPEYEKLSFDSDVPMNDLYSNK